MLNTARALRFHAGLPIHFWGDCLLTATTPVLNGCTPYECLFHTSPSYNHLRVFGSLCYASTAPRSSDKFAPRAIKSVFLGYLFGTKGYKVLDLETRKVFISRHVQFVETVFPFKSIPSTIPSQLFTSSLSDNTTDPLQDILVSSDSSSSKSNRQDSSLSDSTQLNSSSVSDSVSHSPHSHDLFTVVHEPPVSTRPVRTKTLPAKYSDYTGLPPQFHSTSNHASAFFPDALHYDSFSPAYTHFLGNVTKIPEPHSYAQVATHPEWYTVMATEIAALEANDTWYIVLLPAHQKQVGCKWIFKVKYQANGDMERYKARLVAKGFTQNEGVDYFETFAPVAKMTSFRTLIVVAAAKNWTVDQLDVTNAFLHGDLSEDVYMTLPPDYIPPADIQVQYPNQVLVCKLKKSIYGLKQASRQWFLKLYAALLMFGFVQSVSDHSLFTYTSGSSIVTLLVYVDDMVLAGNSTSLLTQVKEFLSTQFKIKDLGTLKYFLGLELARSIAGIYLNQRKYTLDLLKDVGLSSCTASLLPMEQNHHLLQPDDSTTIPDISLYRRIIGRLIYLTISRPDISYSVHVLSQIMANPKTSHMQAAVKLLRYLKGTCGHGLLLSSQSTLQLSAFCDAD